VHQRTGAEPDADMNWVGGSFFQTINNTGLGFYGKNHGGVVFFRFDFHKIGLLYVFANGFNRNAGTDTQDEIGGNIELFVDFQNVFVF
jgi:hypothetical protein